MTHVLRYLLIYGERKKKVEIAVGAGVESVGVETLQGRARDLFNLPAVILQIWDKGFDDWVDLEDGDPTPTNSRIKVEVDRAAAVMKPKSHHPSSHLLHKTELDGRMGQKSAPDVIHVVESPAQLATQGARPHVTLATVGEAQRAPSSSSCAMLRVESGLPPQQNRISSPGAVSRERGNRVPKDAVGIRDFDKHSSLGTAYTLSKQAASQQLYPTSLQGVSGSLSTSGYPADMDSRQQRSVDLQSDGCTEGASFPTPADRGSHQHPFQSGRDKRSVQSSVYFHEASRNLAVMSAAEEDAQSDEWGDGMRDDGSRGEFDMPSEEYKDDRQWIYRYEIPELPGDISKKLRIGLELNCTEQRTLMATIYDSVTKYTFYPNTSMYNILTNKLLQKYPVLRSQAIHKGHGTAWESWKQKLMHKFKNQRKRRDADIPEVVMRKRSCGARATLLSTNASAHEAESDDGFKAANDDDDDQDLTEVQTFIIKDEEDDEDGDDAITEINDSPLDRFDVMAPDTTETSNHLPSP